MMKKKYEVGDIVFTRNNPGLKLIICDTFTGYFCKNLEGPVRIPQIRFEKEFISDIAVELPVRKQALPLDVNGKAMMKIW